MFSPFLKDACNGDSGSPLIIPGATAAGDIQVGISSFGQGCGEADFPGVYTRISAYETFILDQLCNQSGNPPIECDGNTTPLPTSSPTGSPTRLPTASPTPLPTASPTPLPTASPTPLPTASPTPLPTASTTPLPTASPTRLPTASPTPLPTASTTPLPTPAQTLARTPVPTLVAVPPTDPPTLSGATAPPTLSGATAPPVLSTIPASKKMMAMKMKMGSMMKGGKGKTTIQ
jgi:Trypsin